MQTKLHRLFPTFTPRLSVQSSLPQFSLCFSSSCLFLHVLVYFYTVYNSFSLLVPPTVSASLLQSCATGILYYQSNPSSVVPFGSTMLVHNLASFSRHWPRPLLPFLSHLPIIESSKIIKEEKVKLSPRATKAYRGLDV